VEDEAYVANSCNAKEGAWVSFSDWQKE
jgi:hypothetical protein